MIATLSIPGKDHNNRYFQLFCQALEEDGVKVINVHDSAARRFRFDILHIHFPTHFVTQTKTLAAIAWSVLFSGFFFLTKLLGKKIIYTVHNVIPFNVHRGWLLWPYISLVHALCDGYVFLNPSSQAEFYKKFPKQRSKPFTMVPHGPYPSVPTTGNQRLRKRNELAIPEDALTVGFLGNVKPYKNLDALLALPTHLLNGRPILAVVAGRVEKGYEADAQRILGQLSPSVLVRVDRSLSDADLDELIQAVDVVLLPYTHGWNSGAALLVLSNRSRVLGSNLPVFRDLETAIGHPWVYCFDSKAVSITESLQKCLEEISSETITPADDTRLTAFLDESDFSMGARRVQAFYRTVLTTMPKFWLRAPQKTTGKYSK